MVWWKRYQKFKKFSWMSIYIQPISHVYSRHPCLRGRSKALHTSDSWYKCYETDNYCKYRQCTQTSTYLHLHEYEFQMLVVHCSAFSNELLLFLVFFEFFVQISPNLVGATRLWASPYHCAAHLAASRLMRDPAESRPVQLTDNSPLSMLPLLRGGLIRLCTSPLSFMNSWYQIHRYLLTMFIEYSL